MNNVPPIVSLICVTFNAGQHINSFLQSAKKNMPKHCELIIFDGDSRDDTLKIISQYPDLVTSLISKKDKGIYDAMNNAVKLAKGQWLYFIGADDEITENFGTVISQLKETDTIYHCDIIMDDVKIIRSAEPYQLAKYNISHQAIFYPKSVFEKYSYNLTYKICADYELNLKLRGDSAYRFKYIPLVAAKFGTDGLSSLKTDDAFEHKKPKLINHYLGLSVYLRYMFRKFKHQIQGKHVK
ncbi:glycosyltransferase [Pedobacter rhodius]|uniref:Glycosyltransferase n=1 Tax=Pedobacter rhodius TaxID=3004098 RepID=A0ABT4KXW6_9SPHI|nr:glycosyltransferase [Pedobacter sp. SJ11]MCZ4223759.1 glycosyltransferase [Pedobacter sp. SJ11]